jgi:hypothetical protein
MQILLLPTFTPPLVYDIYRQWIRKSGMNQSKAVFYLAKTSWGHRNDQEESDQSASSEESNLVNVNNKPLIYQHIIVAEEVVTQIFDRFKQQIPIWFSLDTDTRAFFNGRDGTIHELAFGNTMLGVRYRWWSEQPEAWHPLQAIVDEAVDLFETALK